MEGGSRKVPSELFLTFLELIKTVHHSPISGVGLLWVRSQYLIVYLVQYVVVVVVVLAVVHSIKKSGLPTIIARK